MTNKRVRDRRREGSGKGGGAGGKRLENKMAEIEGRGEDLGRRWGGKEACDSGRSSAALSSGAIICRDVLRRLSLCLNARTSAGGAPAYLNRRKCFT